MTETMPLSRFTRLAEAYGADLRLWPQADRTAAEAFLLTEAPAAQAALAAERTLDDALFELRPPTPSAALRNAVIASAPVSLIRSAGSRVFNWWTSAGVGVALAACAAAGFLAGLSLLDGNFESRGPETIAVALSPGEATAFGDVAPSEET